MIGGKEIKGHITISNQLNKTVEGIIMSLLSHFLEYQILIWIIEWTEL